MSPFGIRVTPTPVQGAPHAVASGDPDTAPDVERTERGLEARLEPRVIGRFVTAAFLAVWLCGWTAGEAFAIWFLVRSGMSVATGRPMGNDPPSMGLALFMGLFLLFWLTLWTIGGILAWREFLRSLWGEDRLIAGGGKLTLESRIGPFRITRVFPVSDLSGLSILRRNGALVAETKRSRVELSQLGHRAERERIAALFTTELGLGATTEPEASLPPGWREVLAPEGVPVLVQDPAIRSRQARFTASAAIAFAAVTTFAIRAAMRDLTAIPIAILLAAATAGLTWGATWLARGRHEWRIGSGRIVRQRRFGATVAEEFEATKLELNSTRDSDGDEWTALEALTADAESSTPLGSTWVTRTPEQRRRRKRILHAMNDDDAPRRLALWLSRRADLPLTDRTTPQAQRAEIAELKAKLESSGKLGILAARWIERAESAQR